MICAEYLTVDGAVFWSKQGHATDIEKKLNQIGKENILSISSGVGDSFLMVFIVYDDVNLQKNGSLSKNNSQKENTNSSQVYCKSCGKAILKTDLFCPFCQERQF